MGIMEYAECADARGQEYKRAVDWTSDEFGAAAEEFWRDLKRWVDEIDPWVLTILLECLKGSRSQVVTYITRALGVVMSAAALEVAVAVTLGLGLGVAIDLVRECGDQLFV